MRRRAGALLVGATVIAGIGLASGAVVQQRDLRITVLSHVQPFSLPRTEPAPIAVFLSGHVGTPSGAVPPQLQRMTVEIDRHGELQDVGLPTCRLAKIQPASTQRALSQCGTSLVGSGRFWANIVLPGQRPYPTRGRLLVFNGRRDGRPALFAHIYTTIPFANSFVITFAIERGRPGRFGTKLSASLPQALGEWGYVDRIKLTLRKKYTHAGRRLSYFNASCPAPRGTSVAAYVLARARFYFEQRKPVSLVVEKSCKVAG